MSTSKMELDMKEKQFHPLHIISCISVCREAKKLRELLGSTF